MELISNKSMELKHISTATDEILDYINNRRHGRINSLRTRWPKFNRCCMGGIEANTIYTVCGISGAGKSSFANSLETDLFELNTNESFVVLNFNLEMLSSRQVGRKLSYKLNKTTSELYSSSSTDDTYKVSDEDYTNILKHAEKIKKFSIYYVDCPGTVDEIKQTIISFKKLEEMKNKWLIIILDHALLVKGNSITSEREIISSLQRMFMEQKKYGRTTIIQLSQLNREIEDKDRINNPNLHYPMRRDVFGSDSLFQTSDYVIVLHRPEILGIEDMNYGPKRLPVKNMIYLHILKAREGEPKVLSFINNLKYNRIDEVDPYNIINI